MLVGRSALPHLAQLARLHNLLCRHQHICLYPTNHPPHHQLISSREIPMQSTRPPRYPAIGPAEKKRWGDSNPSPPQCQCYCGMSPLGVGMSVYARPPQRRLFARNLSKQPQTKGLKSRGQPSRCNLSTLIVCSLLQTTLPAATCN